MRNGPDGLDQPLGDGLAHLREGNVLVVRSWHHRHSSRSRRSSRHPFGGGTLHIPLHDTPAGSGSLDLGQRYPRLLGQPPRERRCLHPPVAFGRTLRGGSGGSGRLGSLLGCSHLRGSGFHLRRLRGLGRPDRSRFRPIPRYEIGNVLSFGCDHRDHRPDGSRCSFAEQDLA